MHDPFLVKVAKGIESYSNINKFFQFWKKWEGYSKKKFWLMTFFHFLSKAISYFSNRNFNDIKCPNVEGFNQYRA